MNRNRMNLAKLCMKCTSNERVHPVALVVHRWARDICPKLRITHSSGIGVLEQFLWSVGAWNLPGLEIRLSVCEFTNALMRIRVFLGHTP